MITHDIHVRVYTQVLTYDTGMLTLTCQMCGPVKEGFINSFYIL